jgi:hypothetical protein
MKYRFLLKCALTTVELHIILNLIQQQLVSDTLFTIITCILCRFYSFLNLVEVIVANCVINPLEQRQ